MPFSTRHGGTIGSKVKGLSSVTGRVGYAWDRFLGYVKGGGAWEQDEYSWTSPGFTIGTITQTRSGWTVGIGGEYAFTNNLSGFIEYDYYGFGTKSASFYQANWRTLGHRRHQGEQERSEGRLELIKFGKAPVPVYSEITIARDANRVTPREACFPGFPFAEFDGLRRATRASALAGHAIAAYRRAQ